MNTPALGLLLAAALASAAPAARAQEYPNRPVTVIMPFPAGSITDLVARLVSDKLRQKLGQPFIVENKAGASGNIGADFVARSKPDGYTLLFTPPPPLVTSKSLYTKLSYDPDTFEPISTVVSWPNVLVANPKTGITSLRELIARAKAHPTELNYASNGNGTTPHLTAELFKSMAKVDIVHVPYKGAAPALSDLLSGQIDLAFLDISSVLSYIESGKLTALAVTSTERSTALPQTPALAETLPGFTSISWNGMVAPAGTPPAVTEKLSKALAEIVAEPDVARKLLEFHVNPIGSTPAEMAAFMKEERARWGAVIRSTNSRLD